MHSHQDFDSNYSIGLWIEQDSNAAWQETEVTALSGEATVLVNAGSRVEARPDLRFLPGESRRQEER